VIGTRLRFRSLRTRLAALYAVLFAVVVLAIGGVAQVVIETDARRSAVAELAASGTVYERLWALRERSLLGSADVLARDFGFRAAVASGDRPTIESALASLRARAGVPRAMVVEQDGSVVGAETPALARAASRLPFTLAAGRRDAVLVVGSGAYRFIVTPVLAPTEIGWVIFALDLDATELRGLERLSAVPLNAAILHRDAADHWIAIDGSIAADPALDALVTRSAAQGPVLLALKNARAFAIARMLPGPQARPQAALLIRYPLARAMAPYRPLQIGIALAGAVGLLIVVIGSRRLARSIVRPLAALDAAATALEGGTRTEVAVTSDDEIGRLGQSFNRMSTGIVERENRIAHLAFHDTLTGLPNRAYFRQALDQAVQRVQRSGETVAVLCLDLDGFKGVNDTLGHPVGDALLRIIAAVLVDLTGEGLVSRLGGDEFAIVLAGGDADYARQIAEAILDATREPLEAAGHQIATGSSIGIAIGPGDGQDADQLLKNADLALYRAKQDGRGLFRFFEPALDAAARRRRELELDLRTALKTGQFALHYQPIWNVAGATIRGFEALLRWNHPVRGMVPPGEFITVAEETGLIVGIGEWVMQQACRDAAGWPEGVRIAVNVSPLQFRNPGFHTVVVQALARSGLAPSRLEVEITESVFLEGEASVLDLLHRLRATGIRVALDDFGTGYSSLSYLRSFPFDKIKIDRSFVTPVATEGAAAAIVRAIVGLACALGMETTAEGVENQAQFDELRDQGCTSIQGYLFSRPVDHASATRLLGTIRDKADAEAA
jgi:diguanylate cyclase (GGDEF)-like protein